jgi:hypothetical protein
MQPVHHCVQVPDVAVIAGMPQGVRKGVDDPWA